MEKILTREEILEVLNESQELSTKLEYFEPHERMKIVEHFLDSTEEALNEISMGGVRNVINYGAGKVRDAASSVGDSISNGLKTAGNKYLDLNYSIDQSIKNIKDAYYKGNIQELEDKLLEIVIQSVNKINEKRMKMGQPPISPKSVLTSISNKAAKQFK